MSPRQAHLRRRFTRLWFLLWNGQLTRPEFRRLFAMLEAEHYRTFGQRQQFWQPGRNN